MRAALPSGKYSRCHSKPQNSGITLRKPLRSRSERLLMLSGGQDTRPDLMPFTALKIGFRTYLVSDTLSPKVRRP
jgi:hypothetical protein